MLPKEFRIKRARFEIIWKKGKRQRLDGGIASVRLFNNIGHPRVSIVIKKGILALATKRNRLRRKLTLLLEKEIKLSSKGIDLVLVVSREPKTPAELEVFKKSALEQIR